EGDFLSRAEIVRVHAVETGIGGPGDDLPRLLLREASRVATAEEQGERHRQAAERETNLEGADVPSGGSRRESAGPQLHRKHHSPFEDRKRAKTGRPVSGHVCFTFRPELQRASQSTSLRTPPEEHGGLRRRGPGVGKLRTRGPRTHQNPAKPDTGGETPVRPRETYPRGRSLLASSDLAISNGPSKLKPMI